MVWTDAGWGVVSLCFKKEGAIDLKQELELNGRGVRRQAPWPCLLEVGHCVSMGEQQPGHASNSQGGRGEGGGGKIFAEGEERSFEAE